MGRKTKIPTNEAVCRRRELRVHIALSMNKHDFCVFKVFRTELYYTTMPTTYAKNKLQYFMTCFSLMMFVLRNDNFAKKKKKKNDEKKNRNKFD